MSNAPESTQAKQVWQMDKDHFIHPYTDYATFKEEGSHIISEGEGIYLTDADGNRYLDAIAGLWCTNIGHGRKEMAEEIAEQVLKMEYCNPFGHSSNVPGSVLAAKLAELAPGNLNHVFYTCGGSTANDSAIRLVHFYNNQRGLPNKKKIISRMDAYHGSTYIAANLTGIHGTKNSFDRIADEWVEHISPANMYRRPVGAEELSEEAFCDFLVAEFENRILQLGADNVAAFIAEPVMGAGGVLVAPQGYHRRMKDICSKYDMLYIADEVVTAFGRLGHWFASEAVYDCVPDIIVCAKGISSGYIPLGAAIISSKVYDVISQPQCDGGLLSMGFTYSGHPVACAAALKNIEIIDRERLNENVQQLTPYFNEVAHGLMDIPIVGDIRGSHFMMAIEFVMDRQTKAEFPSQVDLANRIYQHCLNRGMIVRPLGNLIVLSPPLTLTKADIDKMFAIIQESVLATYEDIKQAGLL